MNLSGRTLAAFVLACLVHASVAQTHSGQDALRLAELDRFRDQASAAVRTGDYERYKGTCHEMGVLVRGTAKTSCPLSKALTEWKQGFSDTKEGKMKAGVEFRFSQRIGDETTAHETGIFHYWTT